MVGVQISPKTIDWLLEDDNPSVRYLTLLNILEKSEHDTDVAAAKKRLMEQGPIAQILKHQNPDGSFITPKIIDTYGEARAKTGYQPRAKATTWQALFLAQIGADPNDERIKRLGNFILNANYNTDQKVFSIILPTGWSGAPPCFVSNMIWALSRLGFYEDERVQNSISWLLKHQRFDDGDFKTPNQWPYKGRGDRCFGAHSCYSGCIKALRAMTIIPDKERTREVNEFIQKAIDFVLLHQLYKKSHGKSKPIRKEYELLTFPLIYYEDILGVLEILLHFKTRDNAIDNAIELVLSKRIGNDRWPLEKVISSSSTYLRVGELGKVNKWITYRVLMVLKSYAE